MKGLLLTLAALALAGCGPQGKGDFLVAQAVIAPPLGGKAITAGYFTLRNNGSADRLVGASSPAASSIELHASEMNGAMMSMRRLDFIDAPAGATVTLAPGGMHMMLFGVRPDMKAGATAPVTLIFAKAGARTFPFKVEAPRVDPGH